MKTVYQVKVLDRDDYFRSHNYIVCEIIKIDESSNRVTENITVIDGVETKRHIKNEVLVNGEYKEISNGWSYCFNTLDEVKEHIKKEYELVKTNKYYHFFIDTEESDTVFVISNHRYQKTGVANNFVNLQKLLEL